MSKFSGKCDFADHLFGLGGYLDKDGNPVKFGQEGVGVYYSDELKDFEEFKRRTDGKIYQHKYIKEITQWNQQFIKDHCKGFDFIEHKRQISDKRFVSGFREETYFTYIYYNKEYTQKEINKKGVYITLEIKFTTLLDIVKYYPYLISACCCSENREIVYISDRSYVDEEMEKFAESGYDFHRYYYDHALSEHYKELIKKYNL